MLEGNSIRSTQRITGLDQNTIIKALVLAGEKCEKIMGRIVVNVPVRDVECDELWGFGAKKESHKRPEEQKDESIGDAYCFVAIERNTKLVLNFTLARRNQTTTDVFIEGLRDAILPTGDFQITTDGFAAYKSAITTTLGHRVNFRATYKGLQDAQRRRGEVFPC